jgi:hypothetical protein
MLVKCRPPEGALMGSAAENKTYIMAKKFIYLVAIVLIGGSATLFALLT